MTKRIPTIQKYMSTSIRTIGAEQTLEHASMVLHDHGVRHLPVLHGGRLAGMLTERDVALIQSFKDVDPRLVQVEDAMSQDVYAVSPDAPLDEVASEMASKKYGSAVVVQNGKVVGLFTTVDLARALAELLVGRLSN